MDLKQIEESNRLESIQIEAARIVTGATKLCSIEKLYNELKWEKLSARRNKQKLYIFYKMHNNIAPLYLNELIPPQAQTRYNLRNQNDIPLIHANTTLYKDSFLPSVIRQLNMLPEQIKNSQTFLTFKNNLNSSLDKQKTYYYHGSRKGQIYHTRLRLGCSSLNFDLHRKSITDSPNCRCGGIETVGHFLLQCPLYNVLRNNLLSDLPCPATHQHLLYGSELLDDSQNCQLFEKVQKFVIATGRFGI